FPYTINPLPRSISILVGTAALENAPDKTGIDKNNQDNKIIFSLLTPCSIFQNTVTRRSTSLLSKLNTIKIAGYFTHSNQK
ncbi:hypothetical protein, partial [Vibrio parahaemolyticus]|uniref:hypothetical protein n=1 Tax=Vibrio parahaemolyticus TaxID=670 RepID=UPI001C60B155